MSTEENINSLKQYGAQILSGSRPSSIQAPIFELNSEDQQSLFDYVSSHDDPELKIGFSYSLSRQLENNFPKYDEKSKSDIKSTLLSYAQKITNEKELFGILAAFDSISSICEGNWPELIDFIFSDSNTQSNDTLRSHILDSLKFIRDEQFINDYSNKLIPLIQRFLKLNLPHLSKSMFLSILALCFQAPIKALPKNEEEEENLDEPLEKLEMPDELFEIIWDVSVEIAQTSNYRSVFPALQQFSQNVKNFKTQTAKCVQKVVGIFTDSNSDLESRLTSVIPLLRLLPFLDDRTVFESIIPSSLECLTTDYFASNVIIDHINEADVELFDNELIVELWGILSKEIKDHSNHRNSSIALFSPFADQILNIVEESLDFIINSIISSLNEINDETRDHLQSQFSALVSVISLRSVIPRIEKANSDLFHSMIPHVINNDDENLLIESNRTMRELLETGAFSTPEYEKELLSLFPHFDNALIGLFSKLIKALVSGEEEPGLSIAEPIYDFALPLLSKEKATAAHNALALDIFAILSEISSDFVEDQVQDGLDVAIRILNSSEPEFYPSAASFLSHVAVTFADVSKDAIFSVIPRLMSLINSHEEKSVKMEPKQLAAVAISTCEIAREYDMRDIASDLADIAIEMLFSKSEFRKILRCGAQMFEIIAKCLLPDNAKKVFESITKFLSRTPEVEIDDADKDFFYEIADDLIHALKKILKKYKVISFEDASEIMKRLFGESGGIVGLPESIEMIEDPETSVFSFIKTFVFRFMKNKLVLFYISRLMEMAEIIDNEVLPALLEPIETAIDNKMLADSDVATFLEKVIKMIDVDDSDITTSYLTVITSIVRNYIQVVDVPSLINLLNFLWENVDETEEDVELPMAIAMLTLELYANAENKAEVDPKLLVDLLEILPLPPDVCDLEHVIHSVIKIADKEWVSFDTLVPLALFMTKVCLMKKKEIEKYDLSAGLVPNLRLKLKDIVKSNKTVENQVRSSFHGNNSELNALFK